LVFLIFNRLHSNLDLIEALKDYLGRFFDLVDLLKVLGLEVLVGKDALFELLNGLAKGSEGLDELILVLELSLLPIELLLYLLNLPLKRRNLLIRYVIELCGLNVLHSFSNIDRKITLMTYL
jgi:hypothetical protein